MGKHKKNLLCLKCGKESVNIFPLHGGKGTGETTCYAAECSACGHTVPGLPSNADGRKSSATREYLRIVKVRPAPAPLPEECPLCHGTMRIMEPFEHPCSCDPKWQAAPESVGEERNRLRLEVEALTRRLAEVEAKLMAYSVRPPGKSIAEVVARAVARAEAANARVIALEKIMREADEYLTRNTLNSICSGSLLHQQLKAALAAVEG